MTFTKKKKKINIDDIDVNKILISKKEPYGKSNSFIYFVGYNDNDIVTPLCIKLSKMTGYVNVFNENENTILMSLRVNEEQFFKNIVKYGKKLRS